MRDEPHPSPDPFKTGPFHCQMRDDSVFEGTVGNYSCEGPPLMNCATPPLPLPHLFSPSSRSDGRHGVNGVRLIRLFTLAPAREGRGFRCFHYSDLCERN